MTELRDWIGLKVWWAVYHLDSIVKEITGWVESEDCVVVPDFKSDPGYLVVKVRARREPSPHIGIYVGETVYQLRSALDHLVCLLTKENGKIVNSKTEFPIFLRREDFRDSAGHLTPPIRLRIEGLTDEHKALIERQQPFQGGYGSPEDDPLWWLHCLAKFDRHQFLHLVSTAVLSGHNLITPEWFAGRYFTEVSNRYGPFKGEAEVARFRIDDAANDVSPVVAVEVKSNVSFGVAFDEEGPGAGRPVISTLKAIGERVALLIPKFFE